MRLNHNMHSLGIYNSYKKNLSATSSSMEKISLGTKINSAKDNPNKIGQSEQMRIQIKSLQASQRNVQDGVSMVQAVDGALQEVNNIINRMRELSVSAAEGTKNLQDKQIVQNEIDEMKNAIDDIAKNFNFNGQKIIGDDEVVSNKYPDYKELASGAMPKEQIRIPVYNVSSELIRDEDGNSLKDVDVVNEPEKAIGIITEAGTQIARIRSKYGAIQSRLEGMQENLEETTTSVTKAESGIRDTDIAMEMATLAKTQIINDSSIALMRQSNQFPQDALRVLERLN